MSMKILGTRTYFWQWDSGQKCVVDDTDCGEVHFCNGSGDCTLDMPIMTADNGTRTVEVPDVLLQTAKPIRCYLFKRTSDGNWTRKFYTFQVLPRTKPADYVYTEPEKQTWEALDERITRIENSDGDTEFGGTLMVTLDYVADGTIASHSASEIIAHLKSGGSVFLADGNNIATLFSIYDTAVSFLRCDNFGERTTYAILEDKTCQKVTMGQGAVSEEAMNSAVSAKVDSTFIPITQAEYDALDTVDESKYYMIVG